MEIRMFAAIGACLLVYIVNVVGYPALS